MLRAGYGALVLTAKIDEAQRWFGWAKQAGRLDDLVIFDEENGHSFNFLSYLGNRQGIESGLASTLIYLIEELGDSLERSSGL